MSPEPTPITLHVAPDGDDGADGSSAHPFATPARARDALRQLRAASGPGAATVYLGGGTYRLTEPLVLTRQDGAGAPATVTWTARPGERPVLAGSRLLTGWQPCRGPVCRAAAPWARGGRWQGRQLFCDGRRQVRARWPKLDPADPLYSGWALTEGPAHEGSIDAFVYRPGTFRHSWAKPHQVEVVYWANIGGWRSVVPVRAVDAERRTIHLAHAGWQFDVPGWYQPVTFTADNRFCVENALEELTAPGEWCFDGDEGAFYFWPPSGRPEDHEIAVPVLDGLIDLRGAAGVGLEGLTFTQTGDGDNLHREGVEGAGAMYPRPGWRYCGDAVHLKDASYCRIAGCRFDAVGGNAVYLEGDCRRNEIAGSEIAGAGANGVCLMGTRLRHPFGNRVVDNHIHHTGHLCKYTAGVFAGLSDGNTIAHNRIEHVPHHAVNLGNNPWGRNLVEWNDICWADEEVADSAAINCWMEDPPEPGAPRCGHLIRCNRIADVYGCEVTDGRVGRSQRFPTSGIYLDNYSSNCTVWGNLILRCTHAGILVHAGRNNLIENNAVIDCLAALRFQDYVSGMPYWKGMAGFMTGNRVRHNLCCPAGPRGWAFSLFAWTDCVLAESDHNLFRDAGAAQGAGSGWRAEHLDRGEILDLRTWRAWGYDAESVVADPRWDDPEAGRLAPDSPAWGLGFQAVDWSLVGPRRGGVAPGPPDW
ncbi:MAG: right-handed parallel beta-helix repeat-containing protein [Gemmatimonadota bacterium]